MTADIVQFGSDHVAASVKTNGAELCRL